VDAVVDESEVMAVVREVGGVEVATEVEDGGGVTEVVNGAVAVGVVVLGVVVAICVDDCIPADDTTVVSRPVVVTGATVLQ